MDNCTNRTNREMRPLSCLQVSLQHKHAATHNLVQMMSDNQIDLACVQERYNICSHLAGIPKSLRTYEWRWKDMISTFVNNKEIDVVLITKFP
jgi:hypothetical protein